MRQEIERKFRVAGEFKPMATSSERITQGYLSSVPERSVRIRRIGDKAFITVKGIGNESGVSRFEWEKEISTKDAEALFDLCEPGIIDKTRYYVPEKTGLVFEVDEFYGDNEGLVIAEIELPDESYDFDKPSWLGKEVTGQAAYYNASLKSRPFKSWNKDEE